MPNLEELYSDTEIPSKLPFHQILTTLKKESNEGVSVVSPSVLYGLSDIGAKEESELKHIWNELSSIYKHTLLTALTNASETNIEFNYSPIGQLALTDDDSSLVREAAIDLLWEDESVELFTRLLNLAQTDQSTAVRAKALVSIGRFILLGEYDNMPKSLVKQAIDLSYSLHIDESQPIEIRRRALEALSNSSYLKKDTLIRNAYNSGHHLLKVSAIFAMGRTCDDKWQDILVDELESDDNELVYEAVRACGEIQLETSVSQLRNLVISDDREIQTMAIWALGEIGGKQSIEILSLLQDATEDDDLIDIIDEALDVASFTLMGSSFDFDIDD